MSLGTVSGAFGGRAAIASQQAFDLNLLSPCVFRVHGFFEESPCLERVKALHVISTNTEVESNARGILNGRLPK